MERHCSSPAGFKKQGNPFENIAFLHMRRPNCTVKHGTIVKIVKKIAKLAQKQEQESLHKKQGLKHQFEVPPTHLRLGALEPILKL